MLKEVIAKSAEILKYELTPHEKEIVEEIVQSVPEEVPGALQISKWCASKVEDILFAHRKEYDHKKTALIRERVKNELNFKIIKSEFEVVKDILEEKGIKNWSVPLLKEHGKLVLRKAYRLFRTANGKFDADFLKEKLKQELEWEYKEKNSLKSIEVIREKIISTVQKYNPQEFNVQWLAKHGLKSLCNRVPRYYSWAEVMAEGEIPDDVLDKWQLGMLETDKEKQRKKASSPAYSRKLREGRGGETPTYLELKPEKEYEDEEEIREALAPYEEVLYTTMVRNPEMVNKKEGVKKRDEIAQALVRLAQKGNRRAVEKLFYLFEPLVYEWMEKKSEWGEGRTVIRWLKNHPDKP